MVTGHSVIVAGLIIMAAPVLSVSFGKRGAASFYMSAVVAIFIMVAVIGYMNVARLQRQMNFAEYLAEKTEGNVWCTVSDIRDSGQGWQVYVSASRIEMEVAGSIYTYTGKMKVLLYMDDVDKLMVGKRLELGADLARPDEATNPGEFDARKYYANKGIYIIGNDVVIKSLGDRYSLIRHMLYEFRIKAGKALEKCFSDADSSVVKAMLLGDKSGMDKDTKRLFQVNGIAHILAISGVHIAIIGMTLFKLLRRLVGSYVVSGVTAMTVVLLYGMMTGMASSTFRAAIMMMVSMTGQMYGRSSDMLTSAGVAFIIQVLVDPGIVLDAGFQLSFAAVCGMAVFLPLLKSLVRIKSRLLDGILVSFAASLATTPLIIYYFYQFPPYSILLNIVVVPLVSFILFVSIAVIGMCMVSAGAGMYVAVPVGWILDFYRLLCRTMTYIPGYSINTGGISASMMCVYYAAILLVLQLLSLAFAGQGICRDERKWEKILPQCVIHIFRKTCIRRVICVSLSIVCVLAGCIYEYKSLDRSFKVVFMDVGQGDGILIRSGMGMNILIDGGSSDNRQVGEYVMSPVIKYFGAAHIDYAFVTHGDMDHMSGVEYLLETDDTGIVIENLVLPRYGAMEKLDDLADLAVSKGVNVVYVETGSQIYCGYDMVNMQLNVLHPGAETDITDTNDLSAVMMLEYCGEKILFMGDAGFDGESELLASGADVDADILKVGHHGSRYSSGEDFLSRVSPSYAIISAGRDNRYGHPHEDALKRIEDCGARTLNTIDSGAVCVTIEPGGAKIERYR